MNADIPHTPTRTRVALPHTPHADRNGHTHVVYARYALRYPHTMRYLLRNALRRAYARARSDGRDNDICARSRIRHADTSRAISIRALRARVTRVRARYVRAGARNGRGIARATVALRCDARAAKRTHAQDNATRARKCARGTRHAHARVRTRARRARVHARRTNGTQRHANTVGAQMAGNGGQTAATATATYGIALPITDINARCDNAYADTRAIPFAYHAQISCHTADLRERARHTRTYRARAPVARARAVGIRARRGQPAARARARAVRGTNIYTFAAYARQYMNIYARASARARASRRATRISRYHAYRTARSHTLRRARFTFVARHARHRIK